MIDHVWTVVCSDSIRDARSNNVSLINVLEQVTFGVPEDYDGEEVALPYNFEIAILWSRSDWENPAEGDGRIRVEGPDGEHLKTIPISIDLLENRRHRNFVVINNFLLTGAGRYSFIVELKESEGGWETVSITPLDVRTNRFKEAPDAESVKRMIKQMGETQGDES